MTHGKVEVDVRLIYEGQLWGKDSKSR
jgi:hypothetical protein